MNKENKIIVVLTVLFSLITVCFCIYLVSNRNRELADATKFRNEYMELNDKMNEDTGRAYINVNISENNTVKYKKEKDIVKLLESGSGLIYFGSASSSLCRNIVSTLTEVAEELDEPIYYIDLSNIRTIFELDYDKVSIVKKGSQSYYQMLDLLDEYLEDYYLQDSEGNKYNTNEKKILSPSLVMVKDGKITGYYTPSYSKYKKLSDDDIKELKTSISNLISSKNTLEVCTQENC